MLPHASLGCKSFSLVYPTRDIIGRDDGAKRRERLEQGGTTTYLSSIRLLKHLQLGRTALLVTNQTTADPSTISLCTFESTCL